MKQLLVLLGATMLLLSVGTITLPYIQVVSLTMLCLVRLVHGMCLNIQGLQLGKPPSHEKRNTTTLGCCFFFRCSVWVGVENPQVLRKGLACPTLPSPFLEIDATKNRGNMFTCKTASLATAVNSAPW